jgi:beta-galactosidase
VQGKSGTLLFAATALSMALLSPALLAAPAREQISLDQGWRFSFGKQDPDGGLAVTLPHTWNRIGGFAEKARDDNESRGQGWYQLNFDTPATAAKPRRSWLQFDGASIITDVWLNGVSVGRHQGGVSGFRFDVTDALRTGSNQLVVRTDNSSPEANASPTAQTLPMGGDWFMFGGLYRKVSLITADPVHIDLADQGGPGVYARTVTIKQGAAALEVAAKVRNDGGSAASTTLRYSLLDKSGTVVASAREAFSLPPAGRRASKVTLRVNKPHLWNGTVDPYLYQLKVDVLAEGRTRDTVTQNVGIRTMQFDPVQGFFLNGKKYALHGVNRHQEVGRSGWAVTDQQLQRDYDIITEMGANTVRLAHYQHAQAEYDLADRKGLVVWAEIPLVNRSAAHGEAAASPAFAENAEQHLRELIRQNYNHPSIAAWSIANEPNLTALWMPTTPPTLPLLRRLAELARSEDPSRPPVLASCCGSLPGESSPNIKRSGLDAPPEAVDVYGINLYFGWYYGATDDLGRYLDRIHAFYPGKTVSVTEYGAGGALTQHSDNPLGGPINATGRPHPEEVQTRVHEQSWPQLRDRSYLWGTWLWNMFDFSSAVRQEGDLVDTNNKGIVSFDRSARKESFYFYKAHWNPEPMLYLTGQRYTRRASPFADVKAYSNAAQARLTLNGKDLGVAACVERICRWPRVALAQGENMVEVEATVGGRKLRDHAIWQRADGPGSYRILAGQLAVTETTAGLFGSDDFFDGGEGKLLNPAGFGPVVRRSVAGAADQGLFQTYREGRFQYELPLPDGDYAMTLRFVEPVDNATAGQRVFDVAVGGQVVLKDLDLASQVGAMTACERTVAITVTGGRARIQFVPKIGKAIVSAITFIPRT